MQATDHAIPPFKTDRPRVPGIGRRPTLAVTRHATRPNTALLLKRHRVNADPTIVPGILVQLEIEHGLSTRLKGYGATSSTTLHVLSPEEAWMT